MASSWESHVKPHGPLAEVVPGLWQVTGSGVMPRNMAVARMPGGGLWLHSVVALDEAGMAALEALGTPEVLVVPNGYHRMDIGVYKARYPKARVVAPAASRKKVEEVVPVDATCEEVAGDLGVTVLVPQGATPFELMYELPVEGGRALVCADLLFNLTQAPPGFQGFVLKYVTASIGPLKISRVFRMLALVDRATYGRWVGSIADRPGLRALCVGHGDAVTGDVSGALREASARILESR